MDEKTSVAVSEKRKKGSRHKEPVCEQLSFAAKEAFKRLRTNLCMTFPEGDKSCHLIGVTSAQPGDGKSTISLNLAYSLAELGKKVLLIDADMRRSSIHDKTGIARAPGLSNLMSNSNSIASAVRTYKSSTDDTNFDILPSGDPAHNPSELLNSKRMATLLETLATAYDFIVLDLPPIGAVVDAISVSREIDGMLVVVRENACPRGLLADCMQQLEYAGANILGFVINGALEGSGKKYQYGKGYYGSYYGGYGGYY